MRLRWVRVRLRMLKRKLQDLTVCCTYKIDFLHQKAHSTKEFRRQFGVLEEIGRGGFGIVYEAIRLSDNLPVAVKYVEHKHVREWTMTSNQLIPTELCHLETCKDIPGVVRLIDWFASSKGFLMVLERPSPCMDVFDLVSAYGRLDEETARAIFVQVVDTVCEMFAKHGLIHRDIKDENIIINMETGEVRLVDFGATTSAEKALKKEFQGTRSYCPPEWFRQLQYLPLEATSWSLGVLLFILVTGQLPFKNEIQICLGRVKFPTYLSKECCQLIKSCLTTAIGTRACLADIRHHPWLDQPIPVHERTFKEVLDERLGTTACDTPVSRSHEARIAAEEYRQVNDVILTVPQETKEQNDESADDTISTATMDTAREDDIGSNPTLPIRRLHSRYDNISASSLADYLSVASLATTSTSKFTDTVSVATTGIYYSTSDITEEDEEDEDESISELSLPVKSASAYNLAVRSRKRSAVFKSFDRELDTVPEQGYADHLPLIMTVSNSSQNSADEVTICEAPPPTPSFSSGDVVDQLVPRRSGDVSPSRRMSRHRPLQMAPAPLAIFEAKSMACS